MRYFILLICLISLASCKKAGDNEQTTGGGNGGNTGGTVSSINFTSLASPTTSAAVTNSFISNRKGSSFAVIVLDENNATQTYFGNNAKWEMLSEVIALNAAISETGMIVYFDKSGVLKRYTGSGSPETVALSNFNYPKVEIGMDGSFYVGSSNDKVYKSADEGKTWTATDIPQNRFNYSGNLAVGFIAHPGGKMYSYTGGARVYQSTDAGKTWSQATVTVDLSNSGYTDLYSPITHDQNGNIYILGTTGVSVVNTTNLSARSISFQSAQLGSFERLEKFTSDAQGALYATATNKGFDYESKKQAAAIYKFSGSAWQKLSTPYPYAGFSGMNVQATQAGIISAANGVQSKGLYALDASGNYTVVGTPKTLENQVIDMVPHSNGKVFGVVRHFTPVGSVLGATFNPAYAVLMVLENGQWKHTGKPSDKVFVASNGDIYSIHSTDISLSKDGGLTWQTSTIAVDDPLNLKNFLYAEALHFTELKAEVYAYVAMHFGGVGGTYTNYAWTKTSLGSNTFEKLAGKPGNYKPGNVPLVTAAKGQTGFLYNPFNGFAYFPTQSEEVKFTKDGGNTYTTAGYPLPFAGSNSGHFVGWGTTGFMTSGPGNPLTFSALEFNVPQGKIDMNKHNGVNYFKTWARFGIDNKLYLNLDNKIYMSERAF